MRLYVNGVGMYGPGLDSWAEGRAVLRGEREYVPRPLGPAPAALLAPGDRRRAGKTVRLALQVAHEALSNSGVEVPPPAVFASSTSDSEIAHAMCETLASTPTMVSPTKFHNSVHNAPAGYWSIACQSHAPTTSLACYDGTFAAGLLEAVMELTSDHPAVLLIAYDLAQPEVLAAHRQLHDGFGVALLLARQPGPTTEGSLAVQVSSANTAATELRCAGLLPLWQGNPAARSLPLLECLARGGGGTVTLAYLEDIALTVAYTCQGGVESTALASFRA